MNEKLKTFLNELELNLVGYEFKKYNLSENQLVYDIQNSAIVSILLKEENYNEHIIVEEIFNDKVENVNLKKFCSKYTGVWVSFFPFYGELGQENLFKGESQYFYIKEKLPELEIDKRFSEWKGYHIAFAGFELQDGDTKGYAIAKYSSIGSISELREIGKYLINAYIDSKEKEQSNTEYVYGENNFAFIIDKNMCNILERRYIKEINMPKLPRGFEIFDLKGFWTNGYIKNNKDIPYTELAKLKEDRFQNTGVISDLYTENMKKTMIKLDNLNKEYFYVKVKYVDIYADYMEYSYLSNDDTIIPGDKVLVSRAGQETIALVTSARYYKGYEVPYPVEKTKYIIKKIENNEELEKYGFSSYYFDDDEEEEIHDYYIVMTIGDSRKIIEDISKKLLERRLIAGSQISVVTSDFWWEGRIQSKEEYKLEVRTRDDKLEEIKDLILSIHNYQVPEISAIRLRCLTYEIEQWIDESVDIKV